MLAKGNHVELIGHYGGDETHALSAWTSTSRELTHEKRARMGKLLDQLAAEQHGSVFEKSAIHFLITCDVVTHYQLLKHRIGVSINAESARYKELKDDKCVLPDDWDDEEREIYLRHMEACFSEYHRAVARLVHMKGFTRKRAKESARFYLGLGNQLVMDVMFNFRSFHHFLGLRFDSHAQREIERLAGDMLALVHGTGAFDMTLRAFGYLDDDGKLRASR